MEDMDARRDVCLAFSIFAGMNVIFDESLGISTELRTSYAVFIILSLVAAVVAFAFRSSAAHSMRQVHDARPKQLTGTRAIIGRKMIRRFPPAIFVQAVRSLLRASQREEANAVTAVILKLQWQLDRMPRELVDCGITCLTLFGEGDAKDP